MATFTPGPIATEIKGSIGGVVFSTNRGGPYMRLKVTPVNPNTVRQSFIRTLTAALSTGWVDDLDQPQRDAWNAYDENLPSTFGNRGGIGQYVRSNVPRGYASFPGGDPAYQPLSRVDDAPTIFDVGGFVPGSVDATAASGLSVNFDADDLWVDEDFSAHLVYMSPGQNASITNYSGRYNLVGFTQGNLLLPPVSPTVFGVTPFPVIEGLRYFFRLNVTRQDGRLSATQRTNTIALA